MTKKRNHCLWLILSFKRDLSFGRWSRQLFKPWSTLVTRGTLKELESEAVCFWSLSKGFVFHLYWAHNVCSVISCYRFSASSVSLLSQEGGKESWSRIGMRGRTQKTASVGKSTVFAAHQSDKHMKIHPRVPTHTSTHKMDRIGFFMGSKFWKWWVLSVGYPVFGNYRSWSVAGSPVASLDLWHSRGDWPCAREPQRMASDCGTLPETENCLPVGWVQDTGVFYVECMVFF